MNHVFTAEIITEDENDLDPSDFTGLTEAAWSRLYEAVKEAGFSLSEIQPQEES